MKPFLNEKSYPFYSGFSTVMFEGFGGTLRKRPPWGSGLFAEMRFSQCEASIEVDLFI